VVTCIAPPPLRIDKANEPAAQRDATKADCPPVQNSA
jgi:hypothetical protein